jgi:hypothetical protein
MLTKAGAWTHRSAAHRSLPTHHPVPKNARLHHFTDQSKPFPRTTPCTCSAPPKTSPGSGICLVWAPIRNYGIGSCHLTLFVTGCSLAKAGRNNYSASWTFCLMRSRYAHLALTISRAHHDSTALGRPALPHEQGSGAMCQPPLGCSGPPLAHDCQRRLLSQGTRAKKF